MSNRLETITTPLSLPVLRAIQIMERQGFRHQGVGRFVSDEGARATIKMVRPGLFQVTYEDSAPRRPVSVL